MNFCRPWLCAVALLACCFTPTDLFGEPRVEMEVATQRGLAPAAGRRWNELLTAAGVSAIRFQGGQADAETKIDVAGTGRDPVYRIKAKLQGDNFLIVPGQRFSDKDRDALAEWVKRLKADGVEELAKPKSAFGLTADQLDEVLRDLSQPVTFTTKGVPVADAIRNIQKVVRNRIVIDPAIKDELLAEDPIRDELEGISSGTALAAILRPAGAVLQPRRPVGEKPYYFLTRAGKSVEAWPVGWPAEKTDRELLPILFDFLNVEIDGISAAKAIAAIQGRLKVPLLFDYNSLLAEGIELDDVEVKVPGNRSYYNRVFDRVLFQAKAKKEVRVDESGRPFLWITSARPAG